MIRARAGPPPRGFEDLHWLIDVLWGRDGARARVIRGGKRKSGGGGSWAVVPHADRPRFLVPLADRRAAIEGIGLTFEEGLALEARSGQETLAVAWEGAQRFASGEGRGAAGAGV